MKKLSLLSLLLFSINSWSCEIKDPTAYYKKEFQSQGQMQRIFAPSTDKIQLLTDSETCGRQGCEYIIFEKEKKGCFKIIGFLTGQFLKFDKSSTKYPNIHFQRNIEIHKHSGVMKFKKGQYRE